MIQLSTLRQDLDYTLFKLLADALVDLGYYPDYKDTTLYPDTPDGQLYWNDAIRTIVGTKGFAIEIFGTGTNQSRYVKKVPRIVINSGPYTPGNVGSNPDLFYEDNFITLTKEAKILPPQTSDYRFDIAISSNSSKEERVMEALIAQLLPARKYVPFYNDPQVVFLVLRTGDRQFADLNQGILDKVFSYHAVDLFETLPEIISTTTPVLEEVTVDVKINEEPLTETIIFDLDSNTP
jgi:hypothetical protein